MLRKRILITTLRSYRKIMNTNELGNLRWYFMDRVSQMSWKSSLKCRTNQIRERRIYDICLIFGIIII